jgi:hypothetical protein
MGQTAKPFKAKKNSLYTIRYLNASVAIDEMESSGFILRVKLEREIGSGLM